MVALALAMALSGLFFLGLILCLVPMTPCETMLYWPSPNKLMATQSIMCFVDSASHH